MAKFCSCAPNTVAVTPELLANCAQIANMGNIAHFIFGSCTPSDPDFYNNINSKYDVNTPTTAATALYNALTTASPDFKDAIIGAVSVEEYTETYADPTEVTGSCGNVEYFDAGVKITAKTYSHNALLPTAPAGSFLSPETTQFYTKLKAGKLPYNTLIGVTCTGQLIGFYEDNGDFDLSANGTMASFDIHANPTTKVKTNCVIARGFMITMGTSCGSVIPFPIADLNEIPPADQALWRALGLL